VRLAGPVVTQMQMIFLEDWLNTTGEVLHGDTQFPDTGMPGDKLAQAVSSSRGDQASISKLMVYMAIQAARKRIWIANAYFVPDSQIRTALVKAAQRGVDVRVMVPGAYIDFPPTLHACRYYQDDLLVGGVKVYEYQPTMMHSKVMVVDSIWSSIGSINLNTRSFQKQAEANVVIYDYSFAGEVEKMLEKDLGKSHQITLQEYRKRGFYAHWREFWYSLFSENY
jgi:cardiolipin synthase